MKAVSRLGNAVLVLRAIAAGFFWYYVADGSVPETSAYKTDIAAWRQLVAGDTAQLPNELRIEIVGRGWEEPAGPDAEQNRRVEVQWFTLE